MPWPNCDICGEPAAGVASSSLGAISFAYCATCVTEGAEVPSMIAQAIVDCGGRDNVAKWVLDMIEPSLRRAKLSEEQFEIMLREIERAYQDMQDQAIAEDEISEELGSEGDPFTL